VGDHFEHALEKSRVDTATVEVIDSYETTHETWERLAKVVTPVTVAAIPSTPPAPDGYSSSAATTDVL